MERLLLLLLLVLGVGGAHPGARHYVLVREEKNWTDAQIYCREHYSDLATVDDFDDIRRINQNLSDIDVPWMWIGLHRDKQNKTVFKWSDGSKSSFRYWTPLEPNNLNEECVEATFKGSLDENRGNWNDKPCNVTYPFLCYNAILITPTAETKSQRIVLRLTTDARPDVKNPEVMAEILKQIREILKKKGIPQEQISLTWIEQPGGKIFLPEKQHRPRRENTCTLE